MSDTTTSPVTPSEIENVFGDGRDARAMLPAPTARAEWSRYLAFLQRPVLPEVVGAGAQPLKVTARILGLDLLIMTAFISVLMLIVAIGFELPDNLNSTLEMNLTTVALVVVVAPIMEELVFRSWLSGRPGYLLAFAVLIASGLVAAMMGASNTGEEAQLAVGISMLVGLVLAAASLFALRRRPPMRWFRKLFPVLFWLSTLSFALVHLFNYTEGALAILLPLVLPQFVLGSMAAYLRVHYGLIWAIVLHAAHNGFAIGVAALAMTAEGGQRGLRFNIEMVRDLF
ncbi:CPBP family glutamic-type intramembrane protease [Erythrobacter rubeus]|uniref:CPBP family intramembrane metalloprotease n=1 Tax=Erythrobacter rubeus TaxID=2760803 RepID=A0ABR8KYH1_9SPHN|nr:CPBP family glutamic-type intramembrane protease [Erythrobacter rubeus]MBD2843484.1 CPBP family intramembrane metalloprotease [Erythrobacter rubeus]